MLIIKSCCILLSIESRALPMGGANGSFIYAVSTYGRLFLSACAYCKISKKLCA